MADEFDPNVVPMLVPETSEIVRVPKGEVPLAESEGYSHPSDEEFLQYEKRKAYIESTSRLEREVYGAGVGGTAQILGVPALVANALPGVEGQSGGSWLAKFASDMGGVPIEEAEQALRTIAEEGPVGHFAGQVGGAVLGAKGLGAAGKAATTKLAAQGVSLGSKARLAGSMSESIAQHVAIANEQAFVQDRELTAENIMAASVLGAVGPLALGPGLSALGKGARKVLSKADKARMAKFEVAMGKVDDAYAKGMSKSSGGQAKALSRAEEQVAKANARLESAMGKKGAKLKEVDGVMKATSPEIEAAQAQLAEANAALSAAKSAPSPVGPFQRPDMPAKFADLFSPDRATRLQATAGVAEELSGSSLQAKSILSRVGAKVGGAAEHAVRGPTVKQGGFGMGGSTTSRGAILGALSFDSIMGAAAGGLAGAAVRKFGPRASGWVLTKMSESLRATARAAASSAKTGAKAGWAPKDFLSQAALSTGNVYRTRLSGMIDQTREVLKANADPAVFAVNVADSYEGLPAEMVGAVTQAHVRAISYLQSNLPPQPPINPLMPQMGRVSIPVSEMESYIRKVEAVRDPMSILRGLASGNLHEDTVEAVRSVYPSMFLDIEAEAIKSLQASDRELTKQQAITFDKLFANRGLIYGASNPGFQARLGMAQELRRQQTAQPSAPRKPGRPSGSPTLGQSMRTGSQRVSESIGN